ncbi:MAG: hypothetical protein JSW34_00755 [Candidatus Zixiibacteriota bacterium]|nr:MAG: hypothetical protein JSW34_00755 [candidate division Zixibacteria bacterium]
METREYPNFASAMRAALDWLAQNGVKVLDAPFRSKMGTYGMQSKDKRSYYRIEFDQRSGAHINVQAKGKKGPHFVFDGNESEVRSRWRQLFLWHPVFGKSGRG